MEDSLTVAEKVRRQLKAGRKRKTSVLPSLLDAVQRLSDESARAQSLMAQYSLNANDIRLSLLYRTYPRPGMPHIHKNALPAPGEVGSFITQLEEMSQLTRVDFLGILWEQHERDPRAKAPIVAWVTEFADDKQAALDLLVFKRSASSPSTAN